MTPSDEEIARDIRKAIVNGRKGKRETEWLGEHEALTAAVASVVRPLLARPAVEVDVEPVGNRVRVRVADSHLLLLDGYLSDELLVAAGAAVVDHLRSELRDELARGRK